MSGAGHVSRSVSRHARLVWLAGAVVVALGVASSDDRAEAYLLLDGGALDYIVPSSEAIRWSADVWGPGQTLVWEIEDGPDWELLPGGAEGFVPVVEEALAVWSAIETADISWRLAGVVEPATHGPRFPDARSRVSFENTNSHPLWGAELWSRRNRAAGTWEITECNIGLLQSLVELREDVEITDDAGAVAATSNLIIMSTPSLSPLLTAEQVRPGTHITAMGSDTPDKIELDPGVLVKADVVVADSIPQCRLRGEIAQAMKAGAISRSG